MYTNRTYSITCSIILFSSEQEHCIKTLCQCTLILLSLYLSISLLISPFTPPHRIVTTSPDLFSFPLYTCATHAPHRVHHFGPPNSPGVVSFAPWLRSSLYTLSTPPTHNSDIPTVLPCFHSVNFIRCKEKRVIIRCGNCRCLCWLVRWEVSLVRVLTRSIYSCFTGEGGYTPPSHIPFNTPSHILLHSHLYPL